MWVSNDLTEVMNRYGWSAKKYDDSLFSDYRELIISEYGTESDIAQAPYLKWQYAENPAGGVNMYLALSPEGRLAGSYCFIPVKIRSGGQERVGGISLNTLTHKDFRGRKIFTTLAEISYQNGFRDNNISLIYGFPNQNSYPGFLKHLKFSDIGRIPLLVKVNKLGNVIKQKMGYGPKSVLNAMGKAVFRRKKISEKSGELRIASVDEFDGRFDSLWERNKNLAPNIVVRSSAYLNWRYLRNPVRKYVIFSVLDISEAVRGFVVCRIIERDGIRSGLIGDLLFEKNRRDIADLLIRRAEQYFWEEDADMWGALMFEHVPYYQDFRRNGFIKCPQRFEPQPFPVIVRSMENDESVLDKRNWYLTMGDYDIF